MSRAEIVKILKKNFYFSTDKIAQIEHFVNLLLNFNKKYNLNEMVKGDVIFCSTGVTDGELVSGINVHGNKFHSETFALHYSQKFFQKVKKTYDI